MNLGNPSKLLRIPELNCRFENSSRVVVRKELPELLGEEHSTSDTFETIPDDFQVVDRILLLDGSLPLIGLPKTIGFHYER